MGCNYCLCGKCNSIENFFRLHHHRIYIIASLIAMEFLNDEAGLLDQIKNEGCGDFEKVSCEKYTELCLECLSGRMTGMCHIVLGYKREMKVNIEYALGEIEKLKGVHERKMTDMQLEYRQRFSEMQLENVRLQSVNRQLLDNIDDLL